MEEESVPVPFFNSTTTTCDYLQQQHCKNGNLGQLTKCLYTIKRFARSSHPLPLLLARPHTMDEGERGGRSRLCCCWGSSSVWPDVAKFRHFGKSLPVFGKFLTVYILSGKILSWLWQICAIIELIFIFANGQILKINLTIWSHCSSLSWKGVRQT